MARGWVLVLLVAGCGTSGLNMGDDLPPPSGVPLLGFETATSSYDETDGELEISINLSEPTNEPVTFLLTLGGSASNNSDYYAIPGMGFIAPGIQFETMTVRLVDDGVPEPAETIEMSLSMPVNCALGIEHHTLTIRDNILPRVSFASATSNADETTPGSVNVTVTPAANVPITVNYTVSGTASLNDYALRDGVLTIPAGVTTMPLSFDQIDDALDEEDETVTVTLTNPSNAILGLYPTNTHTIRDDDDAVNASFVVASETVLEGDTGKQVLTAEVKLDRPSGKTVSITFGPGSSQFYSATLGVDYEITTPSPLVFPPGTTSQTITFAILGDTVQDGSDKVGVELKVPTAASIAFPSVHSVQVNNDDCMGSGAFRVCPDTAPTTDVTIDSWIFEGTDFDNAGFCALRQPPGWIESGQPSACFIVANNITIGTAHFSGFRPVVLVALNSITVNTLLDGGSHLSGYVAHNGPGFNPSMCPASPTLGAGAGGAGGSFVTAGGNGGNHGPSAPGGSAASAVTAAPGMLRGGCSGQQPASNTGGSGGGAVFLLAGNAITIAPNATVNASGAAGYPGLNGDGGNGGGSGGMIVMWAATAIQASQAHLLANGGGGAEGADGFTQNAVQGSEVDFASPLTPAPGGTGSQGGDGGAGAVQGIAAKPGSNGNSSNGAGGGGGGLGYILVHPSLINAISSPTPATF